MRQPRVTKIGRFRRLGLIALLAILWMGPRPVVVGAAVASSPSAVGPADVTPSPVPVPSSDQSAPLSTVLNDAVAGQNGLYGVAVRNLSTGETVALNGDQYFPAASLYKIGVMYEVFQQQQQGTLDLNETLTVVTTETNEATDEEVLSVGDQVTIQRALELMIDVSSNVAAHLLADRVSWDAVNDGMSNLGLNHTIIPIGSWKAQLTDWRAEEASTSPLDQLALFQQIYDRRLVSPKSSDQMLALLLNQRVNDRLPANLPPNTLVAHKTGNLDEVVNDAGIVYGPTASFILVVLGLGVDDGTATTTEARLARTLFDRFNPPPPG